MDLKQIVKIYTQSAWEMTKEQDKAMKRLQIEMSKQNGKKVDKKELRKLGIDI